jgi:phosphate starvation-inducible PhoH-like protein
MKRILLSDRSLQLLFGPLDENIKFLEKLFGVAIQARDSALTIDGEEDDVNALEKILTDFSELVDRGHSISNGDLQSAFRQIAEDAALSLHDFFPKMQLLSSGKKQVMPKTGLRHRPGRHGQDLPRGGDGRLRPAEQETGAHHSDPPGGGGRRERLGFLPGTLQEKVDPYLRPLYDALYEMLDTERVEKLLERNTIEVAPIAFMRGRTLNDSFIILDEAQNSTPEQMKMVLTRQGFNAKMVVNGDITQIDLPPGSVEGLAFCYFNESDVVRHRLVRLIIKAYQEHAQQDLSSQGRANGRKTEN